MNELIFFIWIEARKNKGLICGCVIPDYVIRVAFSVEVVVGIGIRCNRTVRGSGGNAASAR